MTPCFILSIVAVAMPCSPLQLHLLVGRSDSNTIGNNSINSINAIIQETACSSSSVPYSHTPSILPSNFDKVNYLLISSLSPKMPQLTPAPSHKISLCNIKGRGWCGREAGSGSGEEVGGGEGGVRVGVVLAGIESWWDGWEWVVAWLGWEAGDGGCRWQGW